MKSSIGSQFATCVLLVVAGVVFGFAQQVSAEVVLCKSTSDSSVQAREGSCTTAQREITTAADTGSVAAGNQTTGRATDVGHENVEIECDPYEDLYWVKEAPLN